MKKDGLCIASLEDILAMKVIAIIQRGTKKDFIDLCDNFGAWHESCHLFHNCVLGQMIKAR